MAVSFVGSSFVDNSGATNTGTISVPAGVVPGDLLFLSFARYAAVQNPGEPLPTTGWTVTANGVTTAPGVPLRTRVWWRIAGSVVPTTYTVAWDTGFPVSAHLLAFRGVDPSSPFSLSELTLNGLDGRAPMTAPLAAITRTTRELVGFYRDQGVQSGLADVGVTIAPSEHATVIVDAVTSGSLYHDWIWVLRDDAYYAGSTVPVLTVTSAVAYSWLSFRHMLTVQELYLGDLAVV